MPTTSCKYSLICTVFRLTTAPEPVGSIMVTEGLLVVTRLLAVVIPVKSIRANKIPAEFVKFDIKL